MRPFIITRKGRTYVNVGTYDTREAALQRISECRGKWDYSLSFSGDIEIEFLKRYRTFKADEGFEAYVEANIHGNYPPNY